MLSLDSPEWASLEHAYGSASDIPDLLRQLATLPSSEGNAEPWFSIWSALAHQGDVYTASFAAVPHVVRFLATGPAAASFVYFQFPAWVEICRQRHGLTVPDDLSSDYFTALKMLGSLVCAASRGKPNIRVASRKVASQRSSRSSGSFPNPPPPSALASSRQKRSVRKNGKLPKDQGYLDHRTGRGFGAAVTRVWQIFALFAGHR
jgi:hypothetical protein